MNPLTKKIRDINIFQIRLNEVLRRKEGQSGLKSLVFKTLKLFKQDIQRCKDLVLLYQFYFFQLVVKSFIKRESIQNFAELSGKEFLILDVSPLNTTVFDVK